MRMLWLNLTLAFQDLRYHWLISATQILVLAAILTPLLLLDVLRSGVIDSLIRQLNDDPRNRQIVLTQQGRYSSTQLQAWREDRRVAFIIGHATPIAREMTFTRVGEILPKTVPGVVLGSGPGDPLLSPGVRPPALLEAVVSHALAQRLGLVVGDHVLLSAQRRRDDEEEWMSLKLLVAGVLPSGIWSADGALLAEETLTGVEQWRDGFSVPVLGLAGAPPDPNAVHRNFRLYARDLPALKSLSQSLQADGIPVVAPRIKDYENIVALSEGLMALFALIAGVSGVGFLISSAAAQWGDVVRKRRALSILRLHGLSRSHVLFFPVIQAAGVAVSGWVVATGLLFIAGEMLESVLASWLAPAVPLLKPNTTSLVVALLVTLLVSWVASASAALQVLHIDPGEGLHDR